MKKLFVKSEELLLQLQSHQLKLRPRDLQHAIGMSNRNASNFLKGNQKYVSLDYADRMCLEYELMLPGKWYTIAEVQNPGIEKKCKACRVDWDETNIRCETCLHRQLRRLGRERRIKEEKLKRGVNVTNGNNTTSVAIEG